MILDEFKVCSGNYPGDPVSYTEICLGLFWLESDETNGSWHKENTMTVVQLVVSLV